MLPKSFRLNRKDVSFFFKKKSTRVFSGSYIRIRANNNNYHKPRFAFVVSHGLRKSAAQRNLARRRMSAAIEEIYKNIQQGFDIVLFLRLENKTTPSFDLLKNDIIKGLTRMDVLK